MNDTRSLWQREPARVIGIISTILLAVATQVLASGLVVSDNGVSLLHLAIVLIPIVTAEVIRLFVSPATNT